MKRIPLAVLALALLFSLPPTAVSARQAPDATPPTAPVKLVFIHHSTGEHWLADDDGGLGLALAQNHYFVSDTNYGWGPAYDDSSTIGDHTDIPDWLAWFRSDRTDEYMQALFNESGQNSAYTRTLADPGGENVIVLFKSCFPNSALEGSPDDPPDPLVGLTVGHAKYVYTEILKYFAAHPEKLFVVITAPPLQDGTYAANARAFNDWLLDDWLKDYPSANVAVFDFYTVLTGPEAHHRLLGGQIQHVTVPGMDTEFYPTGPDDDHPSPAGNRKATAEFLPLLNVFYHRWQAGLAVQSAAVATASAIPSGSSPEPADPTPVPAQPTAAPTASNGLGCLALLPLALVALLLPLASNSPFGGTIFFRRRK